MDRIYSKLTIADIKIVEIQVESTLATCISHHQKLKTLINLIQS